MSRARLHSSQSRPVAPSDDRMSSAWLEALAAILRLPLLPYNLVGCVAYT